MEGEKIKKTNNLSEEGLIEWLKAYLDFGEIVNDNFPSKGASSWYPYVLDYDTLYQVIKPLF